MGGLEAMKERNEKKAKILYDYLDESKLFKGTVRKEDRSLMNVPLDWDRWMRTIKNREYG